MDFDTYDRMGRLTQVSDAVGTRTFSFDGDLNPDKEIINTSGNQQLYYREITREYEPLLLVQSDPPGGPPTQAPGNVVGRPQKIQVGVSGDEARDYETEYFYDIGNARFNRVSGPGLPSYGAAYLYETNADRVNEIDFKTAGSTVVAKSVRTWDADRAALTSVENKWGATSVSKYAYDYDTLGRRKHVIRTGTAFSAGHSDVWAYNERNELARSDGFDDIRVPLTDSPDDTKDFAYDYDNIGNRESSTIDDPPATTTYTSNQLNQYSSTTNPLETFLYDEDGNMESDGSYSYEWDAENRLSVVWLVDPTPGTDEEGDRKLEFVYDYRSRRVQKLDKLYTSGAWTITLDRRFVYDGWNVLLELDGDDDTTVRSYTWGLDLTGTFQGAGGIGGLLAMHAPGAPAKNYIYFHDANGNVGQLVDIDNSGAIVAHYEYDPYGGVMSSTGAYKDENPFRFSTKYWDEESGLGYWGYRYYSARVGRWLSRDPIEETGGLHLYAYSKNRPINRADSLGLQSQPPSQKKPCLSCCCVTNVAITSGDIGAEDDANIAKFGNTFTITITLQFTPVKKNKNVQKYTRCTFEWWEWSDKHNGTGQPQYDNLKDWMRFYPGKGAASPTFSPPPYTQPCKGTLTFTMTDAPGVSRTPGSMNPGFFPEFARTLYIHVRAKSGSVCKCPSPSNHSVNVYQKLRAGTGGGSFRDFKAPVKGGFSNYDPQTPVGSPPANP